MADSKKKVEQSLTLVAGQPLPEMQNVIAPFLAVEDLFVLTLTCKSFHPQYNKTQVDNKSEKEVAAKMLHCVLHPNEANFSEFSKLSKLLLSVPKRGSLGLPLYLVRNDGEEVYVNEAGVQQTKTIRRNTNVLEAIIRTRNVHYAELLFKNIPKKDKTPSLKQYIKKLRALPMWGMPELQAAYKNFRDSWRALHDAENLEELDRLSGRIGQALKEHLPWFSICLFCHPATHANTDYTKSPNWVCVLWDNKVLDLDVFGPASDYALYKGRMHVAQGYDCGLQRSLRQAWAFDDSVAFTNQNEVLSSKLDKIIKQFELDDSKPSAAQTYRQCDYRDLMCNRNSKRLKIEG